MIGRLARAAGTTILVVLAAVLFAIAFAPHFGFRATVLTSGSMSPTVPTGGMIAVEEVDPADIGVGDVITFHGYAEDRLVTHRVISIHDVDGELHFRTQGDGNEFPDGDLAPAAGVVGRMRWDLTLLGPLLSWLVSSRATMVLPGLAGLWMAVGEVRQLRRSRRSVVDTASAPGAMRDDHPPPPPRVPVPCRPSSSEPLFARQASTVAAALERAPVRAAPSAPPSLSWSAASMAPVAQPYVASPRGPARLATMGLATVLGVASLQASAATFVDAVTVSAATVETTSVAAPTGTSATFVCDQTNGDHVAVSWDDVSADSYEVRRRLGTSSDFTALGTTTGTTFTDTTVEPETTYEYVVVATVHTWDSSPSTSAQVTTPASC